VDRLRIVAWLFGCMSLTLAPAAAQQPYTTWRDYLGGPSSSHYSALQQIDRSNVNKLQVAWTYPTGDDIDYAWNPIIVDEVMYVHAKNNSIVALNAATGRELWVYHPNAPRREMHRGINYWESKDRSDRRLLITFNNNLQAIDARRGKLIASFGKSGCVDLREGLGRDPKSIAHIQSATPGRVFENLIILGSFPGEQYLSASGDIRAYDVRTGKMVWIFHTVPHPGEFGNDTWPKDAWTYVGGTNVWGEMTLDEKRGIAYLPLGAPTYDFYGADRKGNNLFADCLLALDARTGKRLWHYQLVHHDLWDYDPTAAPQLLTVQHDGKMVNAVAEASKQGFVYVFDRVTGKPLWPIEERPVPKSDTPGEAASQTQPFPVKPPPFARQKFSVNELDPYILTAAERAKWRDTIQSARNEGLYTPPGVTNVIEMPGNHGGANWGSTAVDPTQGTLYVLSMDLPAILKLVKRAPPDIWNIPTEGTPAQRGRAVYEEFCQMCHGADRKGAPPAIPSLVDASAHFGADTIKTVVNQGYADMPAFPEIPNSLLDALLVYLANPASAPAPVRDPGADAAPKPYPTGAKGSAPVRYWTGYGMEPTIIGPPWSTLTAYDLNEGIIKWQVPLGDAPQLASVGIKNTGVMMPRNGPVVTGGGLILVATKGEGKLHVYDKDTGKEIWTAELPAASEGVPAVYEVGGREYIVFCATSAKSSAIPRDGPPEPSKEPVNRSYVAFALPNGFAAKR
jgi:quinoprotein glucose dehydrogenase